MGTSSERIFNGSGKGYLPAGTIGNRTHILSERLKAGTEFKRLKKGHRPAPMPPTWTHILSYKPLVEQVLRNKVVVQTDILIRFYLRSRRRGDSGRRCTRAIVLSKQSASNAKSHVRRRGFNCVGGKYGARTRDLRRDRPAL